MPGHAPDIVTVGKRRKWMAGDKPGHHGVKKVLTSPDPSATTI